MTEKITFTFFIDENNNELNILNFLHKNQINYFCDFNDDKLDFIVNVNNLTINQQICLKKLIIMSEIQNIIVS